MRKAIAFSWRRRATSESSPFANVLVGKVRQIKKGGTATRQCGAVSFAQAHSLRCYGCEQIQDLEELYDEDNTGLVYRALDVSHYDIGDYYRGRRFRQRFYTGFDVHQGETARWFVLTESDEAIAEGLDVIQKFNELVRYLRRHYGDFEYCCVRHRQGDKKRINLHVVYFGPYIPQQVIEDWWLKNYASHRSKMGKVYSVKHQADYLSGYLSGEGFERYHFSRNWVFPGWIGFSQWFKGEFGRYPPTEMLVELAKMSKAEREENTCFGIYLWEKKNNRGRN